MRKKDGFFWHIKYPWPMEPVTWKWPPPVPRPCWATWPLPSTPTMSGTKIWWAKPPSCPLMGREIPIVADTYVEMDFGTGVVKITPPDPNDFEVGLRHNLPIINTMNPDASLSGNAGKYCGLSGEGKPANR